MTNLPNNPITLSIITVCKNDLAGLKRTIESVKSQNYQSYEHIVIDGASDDGTIVWVNGLDSQPEVFVSTEDDGIYDAMNKGLAMAKGQWVQFLNSGDVYTDPDAITILSPAFESKYHIFYCDFFITCATGKIIAKKQNETLKFGLYNNLCHQTIFYRQSMIAGIGFDTSYPVSADFNLLMQLHTQIPNFNSKHFAKPFVHYQGGGYSEVREFEALIERERTFKEFLGLSWRYLINRLNLFRQKRKLLAKKKCQHLFV